MTKILAILALIIISLVCLLIFVSLMGLEVL